ncbi:MAG: hypothetical protein ACI38A_03160 [Candidatus Ornithomonoglobus sp.]
MRVYLDNCSYNRPYDDQNQMRIHLETQAKLYIQDMIRNSELELVTSYVLDYENSRNRFSERRSTIARFINEYAAYYVSAERSNKIEEMSKEIMKTGVKEKDAAHIACAVFAGCDYFISTDDRLLKYETDKIILCTPGEFLRRLEADGDV